MGAGKATSFTASSGQRKDMKQKTFELLQLAEDAEDEYEDEYDDGFDALNFVKGGRDVRMEADSTEPGAVLHVPVAALFCSRKLFICWNSGLSLFTRIVVQEGCPNRHQLCR